MSKEFHNSSNHDAAGKFRLSVEAVIIFTVFAAVMFVTAPTNGDFAWSDAPRHALNGVFVRDFFIAMPWEDPRQYAVNYYLRYPALTILFYPPLFSLFLAIAYSIFGFSHLVAQATVTFFHLILGLAGYMLARRWMPHGYAIAASLLLASAPEIAFWGRQVMLDVPAYAWLALMAVTFVRYMDRGEIRYLWLTVLLFVAALYTKQTSLFVLFALLAGLISARGLQALRDRQLWGAAVTLLLLVIPLAVLHLKFGQVNMGSMMGSQRSDLPRTSVEAWTYYAAQLPGQLGWPTVILSIIYLAGATVRADWRLPRPHMVFLIVWFVAGYLFFSYIMVREPRHDLMVLLPLPIFAVLAIKKITETRLKKTGLALAGAVALGSVAWSVLAYPVHWVTGHSEAADFVLKRAPQNSVVLFSGYRDGSFVFNIRAGERTDVSVARADKLLLRVAIERERGVQDRNLTANKIESLLKRHAIRYVVAETGFWHDLPSMAALTALLNDTSRFKAVQRIATQANYPNTDHELVIYEYLGMVDANPQPLSAELVGIGITLKQR
ncbi:Dolichyl-phosphate-mannose-protein mannosyltransferase [Nitrosospira multiformis]|uniref:Dolichyl-phosphate-mannose-protein mannosyltransferase n=1 Tax=Nitrosospira multiformis TaxID=1231 RepID=A0A1H8KVB6_9PROT|nr:glycosyltransferase family 39 protein [Nitrosospira multiformis]SEN96824.1 Dolichyl-phosphate-mannose-protein mannosyltransferase [Nitrosospira multiformis]